MCDGVCVCVCMYVIGDVVLGEFAVEKKEFAERNLFEIAQILHILYDCHSHCHCSCECPSRVSVYL